MTKEIHFYESIEAVSASCNIIHYWDALNIAIEENFSKIHTTQMCMMSTTLLHRGYRMFVHQANGVVYEITLKSKGGTGDHAVRDSQNVYGMWASNVFRIAKNVDDYAKAIHEINEDAKYEIDWILYESFADIPNDIKNVVVKTYKYHADEEIAVIRTVLE